MDACGGLLIALLVVLFLAGTINGFVVFVRFLSGAMADPTPTPSGKTCRVCGGRRFHSDGSCADCGLLQTVKAEVESDAAMWETAKRDLRKLHNRGLLSQTRFEELVHSLNADRDEALRRKPAVVAAPEEPEVEVLRDLVRPEEQQEETKAAAAGPFHPPAEVPLEITTFAEPEAPAEPAPVRSDRLQPVSSTPLQPAEAGHYEQPRRDWGQLLQAFMEEKNIRWGELLSGMLIVGSAIGLVISLWSTLQRSIPYFPALLFMLATAAIHGAGLYTLRRWKLQSTSRGLLLISTLLIPLNFLAAIALSTAESGTQQRPVTDPLYLAAVCVGSLCYGLIAFSASRVFRKGYWWAMWLAVMVPSLSQLVIARLAEPRLPTDFLNFLAGLPTAGFLAAMVVQLQIASHGRHFPKRRADQTFQMLGIGLFSLLMALGLLLYKTGDLLGTLAAISPVVSIIAVLLTCTGLIVHHRSESAALATTRTAGTAVTLSGASFMLASLSFAWPRPELLVAVGLVDVVALTAMAFSARLPALHLPAIAAAALTALTTLHWLQDTIHTGEDSHLLLIRALLMGRSSLLLLGVAGTCLLLSTVWKKRGLAEDGVYYVIGAGGLAGVGVLVAYWAGFFTDISSTTDFDLAATTPVFALAAAGFLVAGRILRQPWASGVGSVVLFTAFYHLLKRNPLFLAWLQQYDLVPVNPFLLSALLTASALAGWTFAVRAGLPTSVGPLWDRSPIEPTEVGTPARSSLMTGVVAPLCMAALFFSGVTVPRLFDVQADQLAEHCGYLWWVAGVWGLAAVTLRHRFVMTGAQAVSLLAVSFGVAAFTQTLDWWEGDFSDPRHWQLQVGTLAVWCLLWTAGRRLAARRRATAELLGVGELNLDHAVLAGLVVAVVGLCAAGALPALAAEFESAGVPSSVGPMGDRSHEGPTEVGTPARPSPADSLAMIELAGLFVAAGFTAAFATSKRLAAPAIIGGTAIVLFVTVVFPTLAAHSVSPDDATHAAWFGPSLWIVLGVVAAGVVATFWERLSTAAVCGLVLLGTMVPLQVASQFAPTPTAATVLRWGLAGYAVLVLLVYSQRRRIVAGVPTSVGSIGARSHNGPTEVGTPAGTEAGSFRHGGDARVAEAASFWHARRKPKLAASATREAATSCAVVLTAAPLLAFTLLSTVLWFNGAKLPIATSDAWIAFRSVGWSNAVPVWVLAAVCLGFAAVERKPAFTMAASLFVQLGVTLLFVLPLWQSGTALNGLSFAELVQWNAVGLGVSTLFWMAATVGQAFQPDRKLEELQTDQTRPVRLESLTYGPFGMQLLLTTVVTAGLSIWAAVTIIASPDEFAPLVSQLGDWKSFLAFGLAAAAIVLSLRRISVELTVDGLAVSLLMFVPLLAAAAGRLDLADTWRTYHVLTAGWAAAMLGLTAAVGQAFQPDRAAEELQIGPKHPVRLESLTYGLNWALVFATLIVFLGVRSQWDDPQRPWWLVGTAAAAALSTAAFGMRRRSQPFAYLSSGLVLLATTAALSRPWIGLAPRPTELTYQTVVFWNIIALAGAALLWLFVEVFHQRRRNESLDPRLGIIPLHHTAGGIGILLTASFTVVLLFLRAEGINEVVGKLLPMASPLGWGAVVAVSALLLASLWDRRAAHAIPGLYAMGLVASLTALDAFDLDVRQVWLCIGGVAVGYAFVTGTAWWQRGRLSQLGGRLLIPDSQRINTATGSWLPVVNVALAALAIVIHFWVVLTFDDDRLRLWAGLATAVLVPALACMAQKKRGAAFRLLTLSIAVVAALQVVWSFSTTELTDAVWLERTIRLLEVASVATLLYALGSLKLLKPDGLWGTSLRNVAIASGGVALASLLWVLGMEWLLFEPKQVPISTAQMIVVSVVLVGLAAGLIVLAVLPGRDPLRLSERGRMGYVYAAEVVASLLFFHIYLTKPALFHGYLRPYWEFIVLSIAFAGSGLGEWFQRRKLRVLAEPLQRTAAFLPLLPALAAWALFPEIAYDRYSLILFLAGLLYVLLAMWRQSFGYAIAAAFVGNMALWSLFYHHGIMFVTRPQVWLIPPALSVLVAGQLNRNRLSEAQLTTLRYICITLIYVSSTGEMFIAGAGRSLWHPMVLATLAILGVMAGMLMRVRAFLYLGSSFLFLSIISMVWHAARIIDRVWPWWVFGLVMGLVLLVFFGVFEKKRNEVLRVFGQLKEWER